MELKNSYIFLSREKKIEQSSTKEKNVVEVKIPSSFRELLQQNFSSIDFETNELGINVKNAGVFVIDYNEKKIKVYFKYYDVCSNYYLDIIVKEKRKIDNINILNIVNSKIIDKNNNFDKNFVSIVSYDAVSEFYGNKLFPYLNEFERKLRKLLFNVYTLNFNLKYYIATTNKNFQQAIKAKSQIKNKSNISKEDYYIKMFFYSLDYNDIETLLFEKSITEEEQIEVETFLKQNIDLGKMEDKELREYFNKCKPKNDWERFLKNKKLSQDFQAIFENIRHFRNNIAHCKFVSKSQYDEWLKTIKDTTKSIDIAIKTTEEKDFILKNIELQSKSFDKIAKIIGEFVASAYKPMIESIGAITDPIVTLTSRMSEIIKPITEAIPPIPKIEFPEIEFPKFDIPNYFEKNNENN